MDITELLTAPRKSQLLENVSYDDYALIPALRSGVLKDGLFRDAEKQTIISPRHIKASYEGRTDKDSESMLFGRALHALLLEPDTFADRFCCFEGRRDERTKAYQEFLAENKGKDVLKVSGPQSWAWCMEAAVELCQNKVVQQYIASGARELTGLAPLNDLPCKVRFDWVSISRHSLCDVKTTRSIGPVDFWYEFNRWGYGLQLSMYREAYRLITSKTLPVVVIAVENHPPFCSVVYAVPDELLDQELVMVKRAVDAVRKGLETGEWPSFAGHEELVLAVPDWAMDEVDQVDWSE